MENPTSIPLTPLVAAFFFLANTITAAISSLVTQFFLRRKQTADIARVDALNYKTEADARQVDSRIIGEAHVQLREFAQTLMQLGAEQVEDKRTIASQEQTISTQAARIELLEVQVQRARAAGLLVEDRGQANPAAEPMEKLV